MFLTKCINDVFVVWPTSMIYRGWIVMAKITKMKMTIALYSIKKHLQESADSPVLSLAEVSTWLTTFIMSIKINADEVTSDGLEQRLLAVNPFLPLPCGWEKACVCMCRVQQSTNLIHTIQLIGLTASTSWLEFGHFDMNEHKSLYMSGKNLVLL